MKRSFLSCHGYERFVFLVSIYYLSPQLYKFVTIVAVFVFACLRVCTDVLRSKKKFCEPNNEEFLIFSRNKNYH